MDGQTTIHPCEFCGEPSTVEVELRPVEFGALKGARIIVRPSRRGWVCADHKARLEAQAGWQERERAAGKAQARAARSHQMNLGMG